MKPQFEAGREQVGRGGVVKSVETHRAVLRELVRFFVNELQLSVLAGTFSPFKGPAGNIEFLLHLRHSLAEKHVVNWDQIVSQAHKELD